MKCKLLSLLSLLAAVAAQAEDFRFQYLEGRKFRYFNVINQTVFVNGEHDHSSQLQNRISFEIAKAEKGRGYLVGDFQFIEKTQGALEITEEYHSEFWRDERGNFEVSPEYFMPVVRNVPRFPEREVQPGDRWSFPATEVHDLRRSYRIRAPMHVPMNVVYEFAGDREEDGRTYKEIIASYTLFHKTGFRYPQLPIYPILMTGTSEQHILWDPGMGEAVSYSETYTLLLTMNTGDVYEFTGDATSRLIEAPDMDREKLAEDVKKGLKESGLGSVDVTTSDKGVVLNLESIQFPPDSAELVPSEQEKLRLIGEVLRRYPDRDILVEGHTALAGTEADRLSLSTSRAGAVGDYLVRQGVRTPEQIAYRGWGATRPLADNQTAEGMRKNRRVEITILEN